MLRKEPVLGLLGLGLKPTTSTLSYISERRESGCGLCVVNRGRGEKIKASWTAMRERGAEGRKSSHLHNRLIGARGGGGGFPVTFQASDKRS